MGITEATLTRLAQVRRARARPAGIYGALLLGMLGISFTAIFTKLAAVPSPVAAAYRMGIGAAILALPFMLRCRSSRASHSTALPWSAVRIALLGGLLFALNLALLNSALLLTSAATATLLDNTAPIWVGLGAMLFFGERLQGRYWLGLALALSGAAVVSGLPTALAGHLAFNRGDLLAFVGAIFYASYLLTTQRARRDLDAVSYLWLIEASAAVALVLMVVALGFPMTGYPLASYLALFGVALVSQTGGWLLINHALGYLPASTAVVVLLGQPIVTSLLGIPLLGEAINVYQIAGGTVVLMGIYLCVRQAAYRV